MINCNQHFKIAPETEKSWKNWTDASDTDDTDSAEDDAHDAPNFTDNDFGLTESKNLNSNRKNQINILKTPTTPKRTIKNIIDALDGDSKIAVDDAATDSLNTADNDAGSIDSRNTHIYWETVIMPPIMLMMMLPPTGILTSPYLSYIPNLNIKLTPGQW